MTAKVLRVGIAGYGVVGKRRGDCVERHPNLKLVAVCDRVFTTDGVLPNGVAHFRTYQQLLQQDLDVLIVCMTNDIAAEATIAGLNLGLHVFCEKPPGRDMSDIASVIATEKKNPQCRLMYGFNHRYHDSVQDAMKIIRSGRYGNIINMRGVYGKSKLITFNQADWRAKREIAGGGVLLDQGIHMVDLMRLFAGEFVDVQSFISNGHWGYNVEDNAYALMRTSDGVVIDMADQLVGGGPGFGIGFAHDHVQADAEAHFTALSGGLLAHLGDFLGYCSRWLAPGQVQLDLLGGQVLRGF